MKIARTAEYDATPEEVFAVLRDPLFQEAKCKATAAVRYEASVEPSGESTVIRTERILPSDGLPEFAKGMVGETIKVTETQEWGPAEADGSRRGTVAMVVAGAPIALNGTITLAPGGPGTVETFDADLKAKVPLLGGTMEKAAAPPIKDAIDIEVAQAKEWLAR